MQSQKSRKKRIHLQGVIGGVIVPAGVHVITHVHTTVNWDVKIPAITPVPALVRQLAQIIVLAPARRLAHMAVNIPVETPVQAVIIISG